MENGAPSSSLFRLEQSLTSILAEFFATLGEGNMKRAECLLEIAIILNDHLTQSSMEETVSSEDNPIWWVWLLVFFGWASIFYNLAHYEDKISIGSSAVFGLLIALLLEFALDKIAPNLLRSLSARWGRSLSPKLRRHLMTFRVVVMVTFALISIGLAAAGLLGFDSYFPTDTSADSTSPGFDPADTPEPTSPGFDPAGTPEPTPPKSDEEINPSETRAPSEIPAQMDTMAPPAEQSPTLTPVVTETNARSNAEVTMSASQTSTEASISTKTVETDPTRTPPKRTRTPKPSRTIQAATPTPGVSTSFVTPTNVMVTSLSVTPPKPSPTITPSLPVLTLTGTPSKSPSPTSVPLTPSKTPPKRTRTPKSVPTDTLTVQAVTPTSGMPTPVVATANVSVTPKPTSKPTKIVICHKPEAYQKTIQVFAFAVKGHLDHGDFIGKCK